VADRPDWIIRADNGLYVPEHIASKLPVYREPEGWPGTVGAFLGTPIFVIPERAPEPRPHWWIRVWRSLTGRSVR
jgi:hypothetical protein